MNIENLMILPEPIVKLRETWLIKAALNIAPWVVAICGWASLTPYFFSGVSRHQLFAAIATIVAFGVVVLAGKVRQFSPYEVVGVASLTAFVVFITLQPNTDGSITKWVFVLPMLWTMAVMTDELRIKAIRSFATIFAITLVPGVLISAWMIAGLPVEFESRPYYAPVMAAGGAKYLFLPVAMFVESNSIQLPWGGVLARMTGIYDEPGLVGTISAFVLAADQFRFRRWQNWILLVGGILSVSLAFGILIALGLAVRSTVAAFDKRRRSVVAHLVGLSIVAVFMSLATGQVQIPNDGPANTDIVVSQPGQASVPVVIEKQEIRQTEFIDNRSLPPMTALLHQWWNSGVATIMFGIAGDAASRAAPTSQVFTRLFTDYGLIGFCLFSLGFLLTSVDALMRSGAKGWLALFLLCFVLSIYQRPVIWMPYALLLYFGGLALAGKLREIDES